MAQRGTKRTAVKAKGETVTSEQRRAARKWLEQVRGPGQPGQWESGEDLPPSAAISAVLTREFSHYTRAEQETLLTALRSIEPRAWVPALERFLQEPSIPYQVRLVLGALLIAVGTEVAADIIEPLQRAQALEIRFQARLAGSEGEINGWGDLLAELHALPAAVAAAVILAIARTAQTLSLLEQISAEEDSTLLPAAVEALGAIAIPEAAGLLAQIAAKTASKDLHKAARRALYRLKTAGVDTESVQPQEVRKSVLEVPKLPVVAALSTHIDFTGNRVLYLARRRPFSGLIFVSLIINDRVGVTDCRALPVTKKDLAGILSDIRADAHQTHIDLPPSYAQQLVEEAYQRNLSTATPAPSDFQATRDLIGTPDTRWEQPPIYHLINLEEIRGQPSLLSLSGSLLTVEEFQGWHLSPDALKTYQGEIQRVMESPIVVSQTLQWERVEAIHTKAMRELFDAEVCARYRRRLEEMAYMLWQTKRPNEAKRALAAAQALLGAGMNPVGHPFLRALFTKSLAFADAQEHAAQGRVTVATPRLWTP